MSDALFLTGAVIKGVEAGKGDHFFLASEPTDIAKRVDQSKRGNYPDARMRSKPKLQNLSSYSIFLNRSLRACSLMKPSASCWS